ncbi:DUF559 domain-containing protein [Microlunatus speluncae]|uniref:DUF559 domain-containing protein n=1 Tax=Microlunatus speluncae TaxID=2594267 RepID=UPI001266848A|nr:DUF559 domain-containing protein [Microlunatus speluncae]
MNSIDDLCAADGLTAPRTPALQRRLRRMVARGLAVRVFPGIYTVPALAADVETRIRAAALWSGGVLTGAAAARVTFWPEIAVPTISLAGTIDRTPPPGIGLSRERLPSSMIIEHRGLRVTAPALTALDLGEDGIDRALLRRVATLEEMHQALAATPNRPGNQTRRRALRDSRDEPWSAAERRQHRLLRAAKITGWRTNLEVWCGDRHYFIDVAFRGPRIALEVDGFEVHSQRAQFERDRQKWSDLTSAGWLVLHFTWHQLTEQADWVIATIRATLRLRRNPL